MMGHRSTGKSGRAPRRGIKSQILALRDHRSYTGCWQLFLGLRNGPHRDSITCARTPPGCSKIHESQGHPPRLPECRQGSCDCRRATTRCRRASRHWKEDTGVTVLRGEKRARKDNARGGGWFYTLGAATADLESKDHSYSMWRQ
jgi:hypothetical protein